MKTSPRRAGYSIVELMMAVAIVGIIASVGPRMLIQAQNYFLMTTARNEIQRDARACIEILNRFLRQGKATSIVISTPSGQGPMSRIDFQLVDGRNVSFRQNNAQLIQRFAGKETIISRNLSYIAFTFPRSDDPTLVSVSMTMSKNVQLGRKKALELTIQKIRVMN